MNKNDPELVQLQQLCVLTAALSLYNYQTNLTTKHRIDSHSVSKRRVLPRFTVLQVQLRIIQDNVAEIRQKGSEQAEHVSRLEAYVVLILFLSCFLTITAVRFTHCRFTLKRCSEKL